MDPEKRFNQDMWLVLQAIKVIKNQSSDRETFFEPEDLEHYISQDNLPGHFVIRILIQLEHEGVLKKEECNFMDINTGEESTYDKYVVNKGKFEEVYGKNAHVFNNLSELAHIKIKDIGLDTTNHLLVINNGEQIIHFRSKKKGVDYQKETKLFKVFFQLWDFRWEMKDGKVEKRGDFVSLENLAKGSESESKNAAYKQIQRLNDRFKKKRADIEIKGENEKYRLIINKA
ncbi:MAG: hypothetical protein V1853_03460 [bacterium]